MLEHGQRLAGRRRHLGHDPEGIGQAPEGLGADDDRMVHALGPGPLDEREDRRDERRPAGRPECAGSVDGCTEPEEGRLIVDDDQTRAFGPGDQQMDGG